MQLQPFLQHKTFFYKSHLLLLTICGQRTANFQLSNYNPGPKDKTDWSSIVKKWHINKNIWVDMGTSLKLMNPNLDVGRITGVIELKVNGRLEAIVLVENHNASTLLAVIKEWIKPGTTIISDCWKAYNTYLKL